MKTSRTAVSALETFARETLEACDGVLSRIWLMGPGDLCSDCPMRPECLDQRTCLHLTVSVGASRSVDGPFRRFPLGARRVGRVATERKPYVERGDLASRGLADPAWLAVHGVKSFVAVPLGEGRGVLAVFSRRFITDQELQLLAFAARAAGHDAGEATGTAPRPGAGREEARPRLPASRPSPEMIAGSARTLAEIQREAIEQALAEAGGRISGPRGAAVALGLKPSTLVSRMERLGMRRAGAADRAPRRRSVDTVSTRMDTGRNA